MSTHKIDYENSRALVSMKIRTVALECNYTCSTNYLQKVESVSSV